MSNGSTDGGHYSKIGSVTANFSLDVEQNNILQKFKLFSGMSMSALMRAAIYNYAMSKGFYEFDPVKMIGHHIKNEDTLKLDDGNGGLDFQHEQISAEIRIIDFAPDGYGCADIKFNVEDKVLLRDRFVEYKYRNDFLHKYQDKFLLIRDEIVKQSKRGQATLYDNEDLLSCDFVHIDRRGDEERNVVIVSSVVSSYFDHRSITNIFKHLSSEERGRYIRNNLYGSRFAGRLSAISASIITDDNRMIFPRRGQKLVSDPGLITCGVNEGIKKSDLEAEMHGLSVVHWAIIRGLYEEFGIRLPDRLFEKVEVFATVLHTRYFEWYFFGCIDLRGCGVEYSYSNILNSIKQGKAKDTFEIEEVRSVQFSKERIHQFVRENAMNMTAYGISLPLMTYEYLDGKK